MDDLRSADHAELGGIAQIRSGNRGSRIAERIGSIALRLIGKSDEMLLLLKSRPDAVRSDS